MRATLKNVAGFFSVLASAVAGYALLRSAPPPAPELEAREIKGHAARCTTCRLPVSAYESGQASQLGRAAEAGESEKTAQVSPTHQPGSAF